MNDRPITHVFVPPFQGRLRARVVLADPSSGRDVFVTAEAEVGPGESVQFTYPERGFSTSPQRATSQ